MLKNSIKSLVFIVISVFFLSFLCQAQPPQNRTVIIVKVEGNKAISSATVLSKIKTIPGSQFSQDVINDDIKRLYALGYFTDVAIDAEEHEEGITVTIIVEEKSVIQDIVFEGNEKMRTQRLKKIMQLGVGDMLQFSKLSEDISEIRSLYEKNGFYRVSVKYELEKSADFNEVIIKIFIDEKMRIRIKRVSLEGNKAVKKSEILDLMETRTAWFFRRGFFDDEVFADDLDRIKLHYEDKGFLDVTITPKFDHDDEKGTMYITLKIDEGSQYEVRDITINGNIILPESEIREKISLEAGKPFSFTGLRESVEGVRALYYYKGYMNAQVLVEKLVDPATKTLDICFTIDGKDVVYVGKVYIKGNSKTKDIVIRRELRAYPGDRFDGDKIRRSKERLYNLGFFEDIYFDTVPTKEPDVSDLEINVKETKTGEFSFGGGYSSIDQFMGFVQVSQRNFDILNFPYFTGDGQHLGVRAEIGMVRRDFDVSWTEPWILDYPLSFGFDAYHRTHLRKSDVGYGYEEVRTGGDLRFGKEFMEYYTASLMYKLENVNITDVSPEATQDLRDEEGDNWLSTLMTGVQFDNRDNIYSPTRGWYLGSSLNNTGGFLGGDKDFLKGFFWSNFYISPINKLVLELKGRAGLANEYGNTEKVPIYERFYAGGAETIRGYRERKVGPRDPSSNDPIGGEGLMIGNAELTFPIYEKLIKGAVFYDIGNVWGNIEDFAQGGYKQGAGIGVRVKTPIGPIKVDWGYPLSENHDDDREGQFYFSVSHGF